jgi:hypothetical protein
MAACRKMKLYTDTKEPPMPESEPLPSDTIPPEELKRALKAFKKRLKLTRLDCESSLGVGPLSGGRPSGIVAITPPNQYPRAVWETLVEQGRLKKTSQGQYELVQK